MHETDAQEHCVCGGSTTPDLNGFSNALIFGSFESAIEAITRCLGAPSFV